MIATLIAIVFAFKHEELRFVSEQMIYNDSRSLVKRGFVRWSIVQCALLYCSSLNDVFTLE